MVVLSEVDLVLFWGGGKEMGGRNPSLGGVGSLLKPKSEQQDEKGETRDRLTDLYVFSISGFGSPAAEIGAWAFSRGGGGKIAFPDNEMLTRPSSWRMTESTHIHSSLPWWSIPQLGRFVGFSCNR